jgi:hypothetical protein
VNLRHAAALALLGWYLMMPPPYSADVHSLDESAPMTSWTQLSAFDTAKECEDYKLEFHLRLEKKDKARADYENSAACVESTDLRFKPK